MANLNLSQQDIDYIGRVVETEVPSWMRERDPQEYNRMVAAVVDTVMNRASTGRFGKTVEDVLDQSRQFSKITGPSYLNPYGSVSKAPAASVATQHAVSEHISQRSAGKPSSIAGHLNYANPNFSSPSNVKGWIQDMIDAGASKVGLGKSVHYHGTVPGTFPAAPYTITVPPDFLPPVEPNQTKWAATTPTPSSRISGEYGRAADSMKSAGIQSLGPMPNYSAPVGTVERGGPLAPAKDQRTQDLIDAYTYAGLTKSLAPAAPIGVPSITTGRTITAPTAPTVASIVNAPPVAPAPLSAPAPMAAPSMGRVTSSTGLFAPTLTAPNFSGLSPKSVQTTTVAPPQESKGFSISGKGALAGLVSGGIPGAVIGAIAPSVRGMVTDALGKALNRAPDVPSYNRVQGLPSKGIFGSISKGIPSFGSVFGGLGGLFGGAGPGFGISASPGDYGVTSAGGFGPSAGAGIGMGPGYGYGWGSGFSIGLGEDNKNQ